MINMDATGKRIEFSAMPERLNKQRFVFNHTFLEVKILKGTEISDIKGLEPNKYHNEAVEIFNSLAKSQIDTNRYILKEDSDWMEFCVAVQVLTGHKMTKLNSWVSDDGITLYDVCRKFNLVNTTDNGYYPDFGRLEHSEYRLSQGKNKINAVDSKDERRREEMQAESDRILRLEQKYELYRDSGINPFLIPRYYTEF